MRIKHQCNTPSLLPEIFIVYPAKSELCLNCSEESIWTFSFLAIFSSVVSRFFFLYIMHKNKFFSLQPGVPHKPKEKLSHGWGITWNLWTDSGQKRKVHSVDPEYTGLANLRNMRRLRFLEDKYVCYFCEHEHFTVVFSLSNKFANK